MNIFKNIIYIIIYMDNAIVKRGRGRPNQNLTKEEKTKRRTMYMLNKEWYCEICNTGRNYTLSGKTCHLKTKKHRHNLNASKTI